LVWGAYGFIGRYLTNALLKGGWTVTTVSRPGHSSDCPEWASAVVAITVADDDYSGDDLRRAIAESTVIFNLAGSSGAVASNRSPLASLDSNPRIHLKFLEACAAAGSRPHIVFPSSRLVYGETGGQPVTEDHPLDPQSIYAAHKTCIEHYLKVHARMGHITYAICRISNVYGFDEGYAGEGYGIVNAFIRAGVAGESITLFGDGRQIRDLIYINDLVDALIAGGVSPAAINQVFNIGSGLTSTMFEAASLIQSLTGSPPVRYSAWPKEYELVETGDYRANISKAKAVLGVSPKYDLAAGIAAAISLYRQRADAAKVVPRPRGWRQQPTTLVSSSS
jgi:UDP-glucose 4-epimerase